jgi:plastocyanin
MVMSAAPRQSATRPPHRAPRTASGPTPRARLVRAAVAAAALVLGLAACGGDEPAAEAPPADEPAAPAAPADDGDAVLIQGFRYQPTSLQVTAGTTVVWSNEDQINHTATSGTPDAPDGLFDLSMGSAGTSAEFTFDDPGTYPYFCTVHTSMIGEVVVAG